MHFIVPFLALLQDGAATQVDLTGGLLSLGGSATIAGVMAYWLSRENARRDAEQKEQKDLHEQTHNKLDSLRDGYHGLREDLIRNNRINGSNAKA